jgi:predicted transposase/invertase (TIGR01784 family)
MKSLVRFAWAIKRLLRNKANFGILEGLLSELLREDIRIDHLLESESNKQTGDNKMNRVDMLVQNSKGELIIVEMQSSYMQDYLLRMLFGTAKLIVDHIDAGMTYSKIKKVISVNIVYFDLGQGDDYIYHGYSEFVGIHKHDRLTLSRQEQLVYHTDKIAEIYPEYYIIKVNQFDDIARDTMDEWINFLKNEVVTEGTKARGLKEAKEKLALLKLSAEERAEYERDIANWRDMESVIASNYVAGELTGKDEGIKKGIEIGEANKEEYAVGKVKAERIEMAKKCLLKGMNIQDIVELTGLDEDQIRSLEN